MKTVEETMSKLDEKLNGLDEVQIESIRLDLDNGFTSGYWDNIFVILGIEELKDSYNLLFKAINKIRDEVYYSQLKEEVDEV